MEFTGNAYAADLAAATTDESTTAVSAGQTAEETGISASTEEATETADATVSGDYDGDDLEPSVAGADTAYIALAGDTIALEGEGATVDGRVVTITWAGTYSVSGTQVASLTITGMVTTTGSAAGGFGGKPGGRPWALYPSVGKI